MAFDWKLFAAEFLDTVTEGIETQTAEAKEYKEKQEEAAQRNAQLINSRQTNAQTAAQMGKRAMQLGATESQVRTAMASGFNGVTELYEKLQAAANQKGVKKLGVDDIEAIVTMPSIPTVNTDMVDMSLEEFAKRTYGVAPIQKTPTKQEERGILADLFGFTAKDRVKQELAETEYMGGLSIAEINELARQQEYTSLIPGSTMTFLEVERFTPKTQMEFSKELKEVMEDAITGDVAEDYIDDAAMEAGNDIELARQLKTKARQDLQRIAAENLILQYAEVYAAGGMLSSEFVRKQIKDVMGQQFLDDLLVANGEETETPQEEETQTEQPTVTEQDQETQTQETTQTQTSDTTDQETPISTEESPPELTEEERYIQDVKSKYPSRPRQPGLVRSRKTREWDELYKGKLNEDRTPIIVPPRPPEGGDKTKQIPITTGLLDSPTGRFKEVTEAEYWDFMYGETHYPENGRPILPEIES